MVLSSPKKGLTFGGLCPGGRLSLGALRVGFGVRGVRPECGMGPQAGDPKRLNHCRYMNAIRAFT